MAVTLRYLTEFGKHTFQHVTAASICGGIYARVYCRGFSSDSVVSVFARCARTCTCKGLTAIIWPYPESAFLV